MRSAAERLPSPMGTRFVTPRPALWVCTAAVLLAVSVSPMALQVAGIYYDSEGGNPVVKLHPASYVTVIAFCIYVFSRIRKSGGLEDWVRQRGWLLFYVISGIAVVGYELVVHGTPGMGLLIDSFVIPSILVSILIDAPIGYRRKLTGLVAALLIMNALVGLGELALHSRVFPYRLAGKVIVEDYFRPTAFGGHPVNNAMMSAAALIALVVLPWPLMIRLVSATILFLSLVAFGVRLPFFVGVVAAALAAWELDKFVRRSGSALGRVAWASAMLAGAGIVAVTAVFVETNFGARFRNASNASFSDASTAGHLQVLDIFDRVNLVDLLGGYSWDELLDLRLASHVIAIESFWIIILLYIGLLAFIIWTVGFFGGLRYIFRYTNGAGRLIICCVLLMASVNVSLASKGTLLDVIFALALGTGLACAGQRPTPRSSLAPRGSPAITLPASPRVMSETEMGAGRRLEKYSNPCRE